MYPQGAKPFKRVIHATGATGVVVPVVDLTIPDGVCNIYDRIVVENETSASNVVRILAVTPYGSILAHYFASFAADVPQILNNIQLYVEEKEHLLIEFAGSTDADVLVAYLWGYSYRLDKQ